MLSKVKDSIFTFYEPAGLRQGSILQQNLQPILNAETFLLQLQSQLLKRTKSYSQKKGNPHADFDFCTHNRSVHIAKKSLSKDLAKGSLAAI